jgi:uncharacterized membrane protein YfcA
MSELLIWILAGIAVAFAACVQASIGFAYALLAAPLLALVSPDLVPGPVIVSSFVLCTLTAFRERSSIDKRGVATMLIGRLPGAALAGVAIHWLPASSYELLFGGLILCAVLLSMLSSGLRPTRPAQLIAGFFSGLIGTLTSAGGPPIALLYQSASGPEMRSTLNYYFALGALISMAVLAHAGRFGWPELRAGLLLLPAVGFGFWCSNATLARYDRSRSRTAVLALAALCSAGVMVKALLSQ